MIDPQYFLEDDDLDGDDWCDQQCLNDDDDFMFDTYDQIIDDPEADYMLLHADTDDTPDWLQPPDIGIALAFAEEIYDSEREHYDPDENLDEENWKNALKYTTLNSRFETGDKLRPFEQHVDAVCKGRASLFDKRDDDYYHDFEYGNYDDF